MTVYTKKMVLPKTNELDILDITDRVQLEIDNSGVKEGIANIYTVGSTAAITTLEFEPGLIADMKTVLNHIVPRRWEYEHHKRWHDDNGHSHLRASLLGPSKSVPVQNGRLILGTWQQIVFIELDNKPRTREVIITVVGE